MAADYGLLAPAWLLALPLVAALTWWLRRRGQTLPPVVAPLAVRHPAAAGAEGTVAGGPNRRRDWMLPTALTLLVLALAEPVRLGPALAREEGTTTLMLLVDVSVSMVLADYTLDGERVDRLSMAKRLLDGFVASLEAERVGLFVVGSPSAVWVPPTRDHALVRQALGRMELTLAGRNAAIGDALVLTAEHLQRFVAVQDAVAAATTTERDTLEYTWGELRTVGSGGLDTVPAPASLVATLSAFADALRATKEVQVSALDQANFSVAEYRWVQRTVLESLGVSVLPGSFRFWATKYQLYADYLPSPVLNSMTPSCQSVSAQIGP